MWTTSFRTVCAFTNLELMETNDCVPDLVALEYIRNKQLVQVDESLIENSVLSVTCSPSEFLKNGIIFQKQTNNNKKSHKKQQPPNTSDVNWKRRSQDICKYHSSKHMKKIRRMAKKDFSFFFYEINGVG